jgi:hypothetical protein
VPTITLLEDEHASLWYHPDQGIVHHQIHKFIEGAAFRRLLTTGAEFVEQNQVTKWLSDDTHNVVVSPEDLEWGRQGWGARVVRAGLKSWAIVRPDKAVAAMQMKQLMSDYGKLGLECRLFDDVAEAMAWLESR